MSNANFQKNPFIYGKPCGVHPELKGQKYCNGKCPLCHKQDVKWGRLLRKHPGSLDVIQQVAKEREARRRMRAEYWSGRRKDEVDSAADRIQQVGKWAPAPKADIPEMGREDFLKRAVGLTTEQVQWMRKVCNYWGPL